MFQILRATLIPNWQPKMQLTYHIIAKTRRPYTKFPIEIISLILKICLIAYRNTCDSCRGSFYFVQPNCLVKFSKIGT